MASLQQQVARLKLAVAARTAGARVVQRVIVEDGDEIPEEAEGELLICRVMVDPPERPEEEIPIPSAPSPRTVSGSRMVAEPDTNPSFRRPINYVKDGSHI